MQRIARFAGWLAGANLGITFWLVAAITGWAGWWAAPMAIVGVALFGITFTGLCLETGRLVADRRRSRARDHEAALEPLPLVFTWMDERPGRSRDPGRLTPVRMDLGRRSSRSARGNVQRSRPR